MAITINTLLSGLSTVADFLINFNAHDTIGFFDQESAEQVFYNARPLKVSVEETSMVMSHPTETGTILSDNQIINPIEITIPVFIKSKPAVNGSNDIL